MRHFLFLLLAALPLTQVRAQATYDSSFHFYYYDQKLSMFENMQNQEGEIVWMGDSITDGCEWSELFPQLKTLNRGISSDNTFGILNRLYEVIKRKPKKIFLLIGINDIARGIPDSVIIRNCKRIADSIRLQLPRTKLYIQSILPTNNDFTNFKNHQNKEQHIALINEALKSFCSSAKAVYINLHSAFLDEQGKLDKQYTNDGLHLTGQGYQKWKQVLVQGGYLR
jgi:lysophospholipase L1-like esterase